MTKTKPNNFFSISNTIDTILDKSLNDWGCTWSTWDIKIPEIDVPQYPKSNGYLTVDKQLVLEFACTGFKKEDIEIDSDGNTLIVKATQKEKVLDNVKILFKNFPIKDFEWKRKISDDYNMDSLDAKCENGVLTITLDLKEEKKNTKKKHKIK